MDQLRSKRYRRIHRDVYVAAHVPDTLAVRAHAAGLLLPAGGAVGGYAALELLLPGVAPRGVPVDVVLPHQRSIAARAGVRSRRAALGDGDTQLLAGTQVTSALRTAFDLTRTLDRTEAVVVVDALWHAGLVDPADRRAYAATRPRWRGVDRVAPVCDLADRPAESPMETRLRLVLVLAGLPWPVSQYEVLADR